MIVMRSKHAALFVDRSSQQWIVRDPEGNFWIVPSAPDPWNDRQPFQPTPESDLEPIPRHYMDMLGIPF